MTDNNIIELYEHGVARRSQRRTEPATPAAQVLPPDPAWAGAEPGEWLRSHPNLMPGIYIKDSGPVVVMVQPDGATADDLRPQRVTSPEPLPPRPRFRGWSILITLVAQCLVLAAALAFDWHWTGFVSSIVALMCGLMLIGGEWIAAYRP